ncbi:hypothetical protein CB1_001616074 [Camelus ferus]|nr:hypothetical protein CB1_001616074 [Camelus ferus]
MPFGSHLLATVIGSYQGRGICYKPITSLPVKGISSVGRLIPPVLRSGLRPSPTLSRRLGLRSRCCARLPSGGKTWKRITTAPPPKPRCNKPFYWMQEDSDDRGPERDVPPEDTGRALVPLSLEPKSQVQAWVLQRQRCCLDSKPPFVVS